MLVGTSTDREAHRERGTLGGASRRIGIKSKSTSWRFELPEGGWDVWIVMKESLSWFSFCCCPEGSGNILPKVLEKEEGEADDIDVGERERVTAEEGKEGSVLRPTPLPAFSERLIAVSLPRSFSSPLPRSFPPSLLFPLLPLLSCALVAIASLLVLKFDFMFLLFSALPFCSKLALPREGRYAGSILADTLISPLEVDGLASTKMLCWLTPNEKEWLSDRQT